MRETDILLPTAQEVQSFVGILASLSGDFDLVDGHHLLDARSLMGIFALDRTRPLRLRVYNDSPETLRALKSFLAPPAAGRKTKKDKEATTP